MNPKLTIKLLAPYFAVGIFWCVFSNAWLALCADLGVAIVAYLTF